MYHKIKISGLDSKGFYKDQSYEQKSFNKDQNNRP